MGFKTDYYLIFFPISFSFETVYLIKEDYKTKCLSVSKNVLFNRLPWSIFTFRQHEALFSKKMLL